MRQPVRVVALAALVSALGGVRFASAAEGTRLSLNPAAGVLLAGSERAVFVERDAGLSKDAIWSVRLDGTGRARISPDVPFSKLGGYLVSSDGARVVFRSDADGDGRFRLFSAPADGSAAAIALDGTPVDPALADVKSFQLTADGTRAVFLANLDEVGQFELYSVPVGGGAPTRLLLSLPEQISEYRLAVTDWVVMAIRDPTSTGRFNLYTARTDQPSAPEKVNGQLDGPSEKVWEWQISPTGNAIVYISSEDGTGIDIFSTAIGGGIIHRLNGLLESTNVQTSQSGGIGILVSPGGGSVLFTMGSDDYPDHLTQWFLAPIFGWPESNGYPEFQGYDGPTTGRVKFSPGGGWIVTLVGGVLYASTTDEQFGVGCQISQSGLSPNQGFGYSVQVLSFAFHPDTGAIAYTGVVTDTVLNEPRGVGLFATSVGTIEMIQACSLGLNVSRPIWYDLSGPVPGTIETALPAMVPGRDEFVFPRRSGAGDIWRLYRNDWGGTDFWRVSLTGGSGVFQLPPQVTPDGRSVVYLADYEGDSAPFWDVWSTGWPTFENGFECGSADWSFPAVDPCLIQLP